MTTGPITPPTAAGWHGQLELQYRKDGERTVAHDRHHGPMRVLRALWPEGPGICHHVLVHPPGGLVGGDVLTLDVALGAGTHALLTTPGSTRFYRSAGSEAQQTVDVRIEDGARFEWLPLETIVHRGAIGRSGMRFALAPGATMIGWDLLSFGLPASGERFDHGRFTQSISVPDVWLDRFALDMNTRRSQRLLTSPIGLDGRSALATMWFASGSDWPGPLRDALLESARDALDAGPEPGLCGAGAPDPRVIVVRALAHRIEPLWRVLQDIRHRWRATGWSLARSSPRIWRT